MARYYATVELQLNKNGAIGNLVLDHGQNEKAAITAQHMGLASVPNSQLVAGAVVKITFDTELQDSGGYITGEVIRGSGELETPQEETQEPQEEQEEEEQ